VAETKSYYAIIPANVRYDEELTANAKLLYGEITALCNEQGYCWATNEYFSQLYNVSKVSVSKWINQLADKGYIKSDINYKKGTKEILNRYLRIVNDPIKEKFNTPIKENFKDNITLLNNTSNNISLQIKNLRKRYPDSQLKTIDEYLCILRWTRQNGKIADSVILKIYQEWEKFKPDKVIYALEIYINNPKYHDKKENYCYGIMRNAKDSEVYQEEREDTNGKIVDGKYIYI